MESELAYLYLKAFHIIFVTSWFAGLFYLPRIFVNLAMAAPGAEYDRLLLMARKLYRFTTPLAVLALVLGMACGRALALAVAGCMPSSAWWRC
jgi:putative membrane protein